MTLRFDSMIADIAARVDGEAAPEPVARYTKQAVEDWRWLGDFGPSAQDACGLPMHIDEDHADWIVANALANLGLRHACIVAEPAFRVAKDKAARDQDLGRATMHLAPQWRFPLSARGIFSDEAGRRAIVLPVSHDRTVVAGRNGDVTCDASDTLSGLQLGDDFDANIADLVAIPLDGGRALSLTGYTVAVGRFEAAPDGKLAVYANGKAWLDAHVSHLRGLCSGIAPDAALAEYGETIFAPPSGVLLIEPRAFEWRVCRSDCVLPRGVSQILCPDSRILAEWIAAQMKAADVVRDMPVVHGPALSPRSSSEAVAQKKSERAAA